MKPEATALLAWLQKGHGRAAAELSLAGKDQAREALLHACVNFLSYEIYEEPRAPYLYRLIQLSGDVNYFREQIAAMLRPSGLHERRQIAALASLLDIAIPPVEELPVTSPLPTQSHGIREWFRTATSGQIRDRLTNSGEDEQAALRVLDILYRGSRFHWELPVLLSLAESDPRPNVRRRATAALSRRSHPGIRPLAMRLWHSADRKEEGADLLQCCPYPSDVLRLDRHLETLHDSHLIHSFGHSLVSLLEAYPPSLHFKGVAAALRRLYEIGPCSLCRAPVVRLLNGMDALPEAWRAESRYDAEPDVARSARRRPRAAQEQRFDRRHARLLRMRAVD